MAGRQRLNLRPETQGVSPRFCQNCGKRPHEHDKKREMSDEDDPTGYSYNYYCPGGEE